MLADALRPPDRELEELRATAARLSRRLAVEQDRTAALVDAVYRAAHDAALIVGTSKVPRPARDRRRAGEEVAVVHATDWQCGKRTVSYDMDVLRDRIARLALKAARITEIQRADHPVRRVVLMLGGDMVEGVTIFPGQAWEIGAHLYEQLFTAARIVEELIAALLATFEYVDVWDIHGNHGRIGRRGDVPRDDNIDRVLYRIVADRMSGDARVTWHHATSWHQHVRIGEYTGLLVHGDQIRSFGGNLPAYGIVRKVNAWSAGVLNAFTDAWIGHFHTAQILNAASGRKIIMTGSPESGNEYAREFVAATGPPSQTLAYVDPDKGRITAYYDVVLD